MQAVVAARDKVCANGNVTTEVQAAALKVGQAVAKVRNTASSAAPRLHVPCLIADNCISAIGARFSLKTWLSEPRGRTPIFVVVTVIQTPYSWLPSVARFVHTLVCRPLKDAISWTVCSMS